uniref:Uncharacterized protein n=1 Tax=Anguilla anguilla TaxID=7936 RepID=A0A0E9QUB1_ANGAN
MRALSSYFRKSYYIIILVLLLQSLFALFAYC